MSSSGVPVDYVVPVAFFLMGFVLMLLAGMAINRMRGRADARGLPLESGGVRLDLVGRRGPTRHESAVAAVEAGAGVGEGVTVSEAWLSAEAEPRRPVRARGRK